MTNEEKAAIMLLALGEDLAAEVMKNLRPQEIRRLGKYMNRISTIPAEVIKSVAREFIQLAKETGGTIAVTEDAAKKIVVKALGEKDALPILAEVDKAKNTENPIVEKLRDINPQVLLEFTKNEHPQTIALIVSHLKPEQAAQILDNFSLEMQCEIVRRIANLKTVPHEIIEEIAQTLEKELLVASISEQQVGGVKVTAEILNRLPRNTESIIINTLEETDPELANSIRSLMFTFDDIIKLDDRSIQEILKEISSEVLAKALKLVDEPGRLKFYKNMSKRAADMLKEELEMMPPIRVSEVEAAQKTIVETARKLEEEGRVVISRGAGEDEFV